MISFSPFLAAKPDTCLRKWADGHTQAPLVFDGKTFTTGTDIRCVNFRYWNPP